jgi:hypothetical protein
MTLSFYMLGSEHAIPCRHNDSFTATEAERVGKLRYFASAPFQFEEVS